MNDLNISAASLKLRQVPPQGLRRNAMFACVVVLLLSSQTAFVSRVSAQSITALQPTSCQPGVPAKLKIRGSKLPNDLRVVSHRKEVKVAIEKGSDTEATLVVEVPSDAKSGPFGLWFATASGPLTSKVVLIDELATVIDNGNNHSVATAQSVNTLGAVDGSSDGTKSDHYRFHVEAGQRVAFEVLTQAIHSKMDPMVRLLHPDGRVLHVADDDSIGPDCRFSYTFAESGDYILQVGESHYVAGGEYHLRIGDFPIVHHAFPLAVRRGESAKIGFTGPDASSVVASEVASHSSTNTSSSNSQFLNVPSRFADGRSASWGTIVASPFPQHMESVAVNSAEKQNTELAKQVIDVPIGISGRLEQQGERDSYWLRGTKGQVLRFASRTRSLGCATMLQMSLWSSAGAKLAETPVNESDEWSFDATLPEDGEYRLEVGDLLKRGGTEYGYWVEVIPSGGFSIAIKADAKGRQAFPIEESTGGCVVDLQIARFGYEGEIELSLGEGVDGLRLLNPRIAKGARGWIMPL